MKWMSFNQAGRPGFGLVVDQSVLEAPADMAQQWPSLWHVVSHGLAREVAEGILKNPRVWPLAELAVADTGIGNVEDKVRKNHRKTLGLPMRVGGKTHHLEQLAHFMLVDQFDGLRTQGQARFSHSLGQT